jgi:hypothetical protein
MGFSSFLKYTFIIFAAHLATSCGAPFENHGLQSLGNAESSTMQSLVTTYRACIWYHCKINNIKLTVHVTPLFNLH